MGIACFGFQMEHLSYSGFVSRTYKGVVFASLNFNFKNRVEATRKFASSVFPLSNLIYSTNLHSYCYMGSYTQKIPSFPDVIPRSFYTIGK
jgi:hypothetical protein